MSRFHRALLWLALLVTPLGAQARDRVAVLELSAKAGVSQDLVDALADVVANTIRETRRFDVVAKSDIRAMLGMEKLKESLDCEDTSCFVNIAGALGVDLIVAGNVSKVGPKLLVNLKPIEQARARVRNGISRTVSRGEAALLDELPSIVLELFADLLPATESHPGPAAGGRTGALDGGSTGTDARWNAGVGVPAEIQSAPPGATVSLDGRDVGVTPWSDFVPPGLHEVVLTKPHYRSAKKRISIRKRSTGTNRFSFELEENFGVLVVVSEPAGAEVTLDGRGVGRADPELTVTPVNPGLHDLTVSLAGHYPYRSQLRVAPKLTERIACTLEPMLGVLQVLARDAAGASLNATVHIDGREVGETPFSDRLRVGEYALVLRAGDLAYAERITIPHKEILKIEAELTATGATADEGAGDAPAEGEEAEEEAPDSRRGIYIEGGYRTGMIWLMDRQQSVYSADGSKIGIAESSSGIASLPIRMTLDDGTTGHGFELVLGSRFQYFFLRGLFEFVEWSGVRTREKHPDEVGETISTTSYQRYQFGIGGGGEVAFEPVYITFGADLLMGFTDVTVKASSHDGSVEFDNYLSENERPVGASSGSTGSSAADMNWMGLFHAGVDVNLWTPTLYAYADVGVEVSVHIGWRLSAGLGIYYSGLYN